MEVPTSILVQTEPSMHLNGAMEGILDNDARLNYAPISYLDTSFEKPRMYTGGYPKDLMGQKTWIANWHPENQATYPAPNWDATKTEVVMAGLNTGIKLVMDYTEAVFAGQDMNGLAEARPAATKLIFTLANYGVMNQLVADLGQFEAVSVQRNNPRQQYDVDGRFDNYTCVVDLAVLARNEQAREFLVQQQQILEQNLASGDPVQFIEDYN